MTFSRRPLIIAILSLVGLGTAYSLLVGTLWFIEARSARSTVSELSITLAEEQASLETLSTDTEKLASAAEENVTTIGDLANTRAQAQDNFILYGFTAFYLAECVREREELIDVIKHRYDYYLWSIRAVESDLNAYCQEAHALYLDLLAEDEG